MSAIEPRSAVPPRPALEQEPSETRFGALQELPLPGPGGAIGDAAAPDPAPFEPSPEETEVASPDSQPAESAEPPAVATLLAPPVDSREGLAGLSASADPSLEEPSGAALSPIPGASLPLPVADHHATTPAAMPSPPSVAMTSPTPAPSVPPAPSHPTAVVANPTPAPSNPPPEPSAPPAPASGSGEPATLVLSEVPRARVESETDVVGGRIEPITHVVRRGENFFTIARYYYGSGRFYRALWKANADRVPKIDELYVGTLILVPAPEDLDKAYIDPPRPRPVVGSSPSSSLSPGDPSRPDRDDRTERTAGRREEVELALPRVTPARSTTAPLRMTEVASEPVPTPRSAMRVHIVRQYETLRSIAREELGDSRWESELLRLNADQITDPYNLAVGLRLRLPEGSRRE